MSRRAERLLWAVLGVGAVAVLIALPRPGGRSPIGHPVPGIAAIINASAPSDDIFHGQFCGGTLVAPSGVLTAAHCVFGRRAESLDVVVGADNLCQDGAIDGDRVRVAAITIHHLYDPVAGRYDLAMLELERPSRDPVVPIAQGAGVGHAVALGWGRASPGGVATCRLERVSLEVLSPEECARVIPVAGTRMFAQSSMVCARPSEGGDTCSGDSGGPLLAEESGELRLLGVTSWGRGCGVGVPGVYAKASGWPRAGELSSALKADPLVSSGRP